ncbi:unnamed protein product [Darwinula stevensoni]|uniref:Uncharacterized protein n=1 Tax=Darwinula stevensoni TaxID=69355 RepID=A0A7R8XJB1_9CRUS|nr:unnamed protein product [Darwinula stevensoni]CAG0894661.1 unnamed protein product [Darwinula stevensoni]
MERKQGNGLQDPVQNAKRPEVLQEHNCEDMKKLACVRRLERIDAVDPRQSDRMKVRLGGYEDFPFCEGAENYQKEHYPEAEKRAYSFPAGYVIKGKEQEELFKKVQTTKPTEKIDENLKIPKQFTAEAKVFDYLKEELTNTPSFITYGYDFSTTFYKAMGIAGKWTKKGETHWKRKGFDVLRGELDVCGIFFDGSRVFLLLFEVKSIKGTDNQQLLKDRAEGAVDQLKKCEQVLRQILGATTFSDIFICSFVAFPYVSRRDVVASLKCDCSANILTEDDLEARGTFRKFLERHEITLTRQATIIPAAEECYLDVMRTYLAASASVECMPRTIGDLHKNIDERMQKALVLLTPHQRQILNEDHSVLFLTGGQGTGKTYLLLNRAERLARIEETVIIVNMSEGELTQKMRAWRELPEFQEFKDYVTIMDTFEFIGCDRREFDLLLDKINDKKHCHVLIDELQINFGMEGKDAFEIGTSWRNLADQKECKSLWINWRPSDTTYPETLDIQVVLDSLAREKVELLMEIKRNTKELAEFVIEVSRFIQKRFPCFDYLPMQGLEHGFHEKDDPLRKNQIPQVVFVQSPPTENEFYRWVSEVVMEISLWIPNSGPLTIITGTDRERNELVRELGNRLGQGVAFLDSQGNLLRHPQPRFLFFYQKPQPRFLVFCELQVTGMSFQNLILLDDGKTPYGCWSRLVGMARESLHVITRDPLPSGHWEEPAQMGLISCCSFRKPRSPSSMSQNPLQESSLMKISWTNFLEETSPPLPDTEIEECKFELIFGPNRSGKTAILFNRLKKKSEQENEEMLKSEETSSRWKTSEGCKESEKGERKHRILFVDCSRWSKNGYPPNLFLVDAKIRLKKREMLNVVEVYDVHDLIRQHCMEEKVSPDPQVLKELLVRMLEKGMNEGQRFHLAFDNVPIHGYASSADTESLRKEWRKILSAFSSHASLASLAIAFCPYVRYSRATFDVEKFKKGFQFSSETKVKILEGCRDVGFPSLLRYVLSHESPQELKVKPGTLNTRPQPSSLVFGEKPTLVTPPVGLHYHGGWKCIGGRGRGCIAVTAASYFHSQPHGSIVVLVSDKEIQQIFTEALRLMGSKVGSTAKEAPQIYEVKDYRGCENSGVMCVGVEDAWMVEGISRAIQFLFVVDGGASAAAQSRMALWMEMERRGLLLHRPLPSSNALDTLSDEDWKALNQISPFLQVLIF